MRHIILALSDDVCRAGLEATFKDEKWNCTSDVSNRHELLQLMRGPAKRMVIIDSNFCPHGSRSLIRAIKREDAAAKVLYWSFKATNAIDHFLSEEREHINAYMYQYTDRQEWLKACMQVHLDYTYFTPYLASMFKRLRNQDKESTLLSGLSKRERVVLRMLCSGDTVSDIAQRLFISRKTVNTFRYRLFKKTNTQSDVQLVHLAISEGLVPLIPHPYEHGQLPEPV